MRAIAFVSSAVLFVACGVACGGAKLTAQTELRDDDLTTSSRYGAPTPAPSFAPPPTAPAPTTSPPADPSPSTGVADIGPSCPLRCVIATPRNRALRPDEEERLRGAFNPTVGGLRACMTSEHYEGRRARAPALTIRFSSSGDLLDVGVDGSGWGYAADSCFQSVVRGSTAGPDVHVDGPATVRCAERCERPTKKWKKK